MEKTQLISLNYTIPTSLQEMIALRQQPVTDELIVTAIAGVIKMARDREQSLEDLTAEVLEDDNVLDLVQRRWLSDVVAQAWQHLS
jgi:uncharacterized protein (DUF4213/DUF364 family)